MTHQDPGGTPPGSDRASRGDSEAAVPQGAVRSALAELDLHPSKALGQNFLHDPNMARWIADQVDASRVTQVIEVGPGLGALTLHLAAKGLPVLAIEKDHRLAARLAERYVDRGIEVVRADATEFDLRPRFARGPAAFVGNLPYRVTTPLLFRFLGEASPAQQGIIMVQREVALRLAASPSTPEYGALTLAIARRWRVEYLKTVPPRLFFPVPQVDSAVLRLTRRPAGEFPPCDPGRFEEVVRAGFSQRRKQLRKLLAAWIPDWRSVAAELGVREEVRAEDLDLGQWIHLARRSGGETDDAAQRPGEEWFDLVDAEDRVTGRATRGEVHVNNLRHRAVHLFVFNQAGELFLQKRSPWKDRHPGVWDSSASGHVDSGEDYDAAAVRELREELGAEGTVEPIARIPASERTGMEFVRLYRVSHGGPFRLPPAEIETGGFFPMGVVREWAQRRPDDFAPGFLECLSVFPG